MTKLLSQRIAILIGAAATLSSCYYDPYYSGYGVGTSYGVSGGGNAFVSTSLSYWAYDPVVRCYYDRRRNCYYDPYLNGYYPRGYRPRPIYNCPHPYGWKGKGNAPVPHGVKGRTLDRNRNRVAQLQASNYQWARNVRGGNEASGRRIQGSQPQFTGSPRNGRSLNRQVTQNNPFGNRGRTVPSASNATTRNQASIEASRARSTQLRQQALQNQRVQRQGRPQTQAPAPRRAQQSQSSGRQRATRQSSQGATNPRTSQGTQRQAAPANSRRRTIN